MSHGYGDPQSTPPRWTPPQWTPPQQAQPQQAQPQHVPTGTNPWAGDSVTFGYPQASDTRSFGYATGAGNEPPNRRRSRAPILISIAVAVSLLLGGVAYAAAYMWYGWGTTQPEAVLPGSASVFARVDLSPGLGQQLKLNRLADKFPKDGKSTEAFVEQLKRDLVEDLGLDPLTYDADIKPWFAERVGVAIWSQAGSDRGVCTLIALASSDDAAAATALAKVRDAKGADDVGFTFTDGYAVVARCQGDANGQAAADAAVAEAKTQSLASRPAFADSLAALPSGQTALGWADLGAAVNLLPRLISGGLEGRPDGGFDGGFDGGGTAGSVTAGSVKGELIVGLLATDDGVDLRYRLRGGGETSAAKDVLDELGALPANTAIGLSADLSGSGPAAADLEKSLAGLGGPGGAPFAAFADGVRAILGSVFSVSITDLKDDLALRIVARAANAEKAGKIAAVFDQLSSESGGLPNGIKVDTSGDTVTVTTAEYKADGGTLNDAALYRDAMGGATGTSTVAAYVDVQKLAAEMDLDAKEQGNLRPVKAFGFTAGYDGGTLVGLLRVIVR